MSNDNVPLIRDGLEPIIQNQSSLTLEDLEDALEDFSCVLDLL